MEINLPAISQNIEAIKQRVPDKQFLAVVKCNAYSHGVVDVAKHIQDQVDWFAVASVDEGIELRRSNITKPILVFGIPTYETAAAYQTHNLTATVSHISHFSILMDGTDYHLNFDTGMGRLGFSPEQAKEVRQQAVLNQRLTCSGIYSHFATADDPGSDFVGVQHSRFMDIIKHFEEIPIKHICNTGASTNYDLEPFDMIRIGLGMLGYNPGLTRHNWLKPVLNWETKVGVVRPIKKGETVSYGARWTCPEDGYLATIPVGYGDGIPRSLSNKLKVAINGNLYPQVGSVTMDYIMVFLGDDKLSPETDVTLMGGDALNAADWAELVGTNIHEILTNLKGRFVRNYLKY
ncbi:alanine racemase [Rhodohalobacter halophilus]|uniref:alanine racemase n=1 Tax=Rhodohalobacter halophilus TaxID=1812810 RepID=UPI00083FC138|nr:alanine racemase [Rhodohalobacter halophilus]